MNDDHPRKTVDATALAILFGAQNMPQDVQITGMKQLADWPQFVAVWSKMFGDWPVPRSRMEWLAACVRADLSPDLFAVETYTPQDVLAVLAERLAQQERDDATARAAVLQLMAASMEDDRFTSPRQLADSFGCDYEPLRQRLIRWRNANPSSVNRDWIENAEPGPKSPKYLYRVSAVKHIIENARKATPD